MRRAEIISALVLLVVLAVHAFAKLENGLQSEMLWSCNVTALLIAVGTLTDKRALTSVGWLTFVTVGLGLWFVDLIAGATTTWPSATAHLLSPVVGFLHIRRVGLWRYTVPAAFGLHLVLFMLSLLFTAPDLNINMTHAVWPPIAAWFPDIWAYHLLNTAGLLLALNVGAWVVARVQSRGA